MTSYYNTIESNICSLMTTILNSSIYSLLSMSIVLQWSPDSNKLIIPRILEKNNWWLSKSLNLFNVNFMFEETVFPMNKKEQYEDS